MEDFSGVKRRQEVRGEVRGITVIDDFAHHPTAIEETLGAVIEKYQGRRVLAILEPRSNTMKLGTMKERLAASLASAEKVFCYQGPGVQWSASEALKPLGEKAFCTRDFEALMGAIVSEARPGDVLLCMSNGGFNNIHAKLLAALAQ